MTPPQVPVALLVTACSLMIDPEDQLPSDSDWPPGFVAITPTGLPSDVFVTYKDILLEDKTAVEIGVQEYAYEGMPGRPYYATTTSYLWWTALEASGEPCRVTSVKVHRNVEMKFYRAWTSDPGSELATWWRKRLKHTTEHELMHRYVGVAAQSAIESRLLALPPQPNCDAALGWANETGKAILRQARVVSRAIDVREDGVDPY